MSFARVRSACALASWARADWTAASYSSRWRVNKVWPSLTSVPSLNSTCSSTPATRARISTVGIASVRAVKSRTIGTVRWVTSATTTAGGGGAGGSCLALFARSHPASAINRARTNCKHPRHLFKAGSVVGEAELDRVELALADAPIEDRCVSRRRHHHRTPPLSPDETRKISGIFSALDSWGEALYHARRYTMRAA